MGLPQDTLVMEANYQTRNVGHHDIKPVLTASKIGQSNNTEIYFIMRYFMKILLQQCEGLSGHKFVLIGNFANGIK